MKNTKIISGFPGVGKSYLFGDSAYSSIDSDSSQFSWIKDRNGDNTADRNPNFPSNYIEHIKYNIGKVDFIFVSTHLDVRNALVANNLHFTLVYPHKSLLFEYLARYKNRGNSDSFLDLVLHRWKIWIDELDAQMGCDKIILQSNQYLKDVI